MRKELVIFLIILGVFVVASVVIIFFFPSLLNFSKSSTGASEGNQNNILEVTISAQDGDPIPYIEVNLWTSGSTGDPQKVATTSSEGIATFTLAEGDYEIGFNQNNFPSVLTYPQKTPITVIQGNNQETIVLYSA